MENLNDIFNLSVDDFKTEDKRETTIYKPDANSGRDGIYKSVIRFIPWHENPKKSVMQKWSCWLTNPLTEESKMIDCPSSVGKKSVLQDMYWKLKKSESVAEQKLAENFSRRQSFASLVQIIKDDNRPETVGKILIFKYGVKIYNKIQAEMKPEFGKPHIPFDLFEGKPFLIHVTKVAGFNNYDNCRFLDEKVPITIGGTQMEKNQDDLAKIMEFLKSSPDLNSYDYREWDDNANSFVNDVIRNTVPGGRMVESVEKSNRETRPTTPVQTEAPRAAATSTKTATDELKLPELGTSDDLNFDSDFGKSFDDELYGSL